ncbi:MAG TPA: NAD(P)-dependent oxidoreductase [Polyangiaceae bacterium]|nr:NAD(P)-dependent oxidoreductase [Polyangiaceae bacterium]
MARVLVTGAAGAIGQPVCEELERRGHQVRGFDLRKASRPLDFVVADLAERAAVQRATADMDAVVHLGAMPDDGPFDDLLGPNVVGLFNVFDAARKASLKRVVIASSIQVVNGRPRGHVATAADRFPTNHYGLTKLWAEDMGEMYARCFGMSVIAARISWMVRDRVEAEKMLSFGAFNHYLSRGDAGRFFAQAVAAEKVSFAVLYVSGPKGNETVELEPARRLIGYEPQDEWPRGLPPDAEGVIARS